MPAGSRHEARERAMSLLYEADARGMGVEELLAEQLISPDPFAVELVEGVAAARDKLDELIARYARGWALDRMPVLDLTILRLAVWELAQTPETPTGAAISEAVELAKRYSTEESGKFVNGVLSSIAAEVRG